MTSASRILEIYISGHCFVSDYTYEVVEMIQREFPQVDVYLIDIDQTVDVPEAIFATPTYLLNGRIWSLGNPSFEKVREVLG